MVTPLTSHRSCRQKEATNCPALGQQPCGWTVACISLAVSQSKGTAAGAQPALPQAHPGWPQGQSSTPSRAPEELVAVSRCEACSLARHRPASLRSSWPIPKDPRAGDPVALDALRLAAVKSPGGVWADVAHGDLQAGPLGFQAERGRLLVGAAGLAGPNPKPWPDPQRVGQWPAASSLWVGWLWVLPRSEGPGPSTSLSPAASRSHPPLLPRCAACGGGAGPALARATSGLDLHGASATVIEVRWS